VCNEIESFHGGECALRTKWDVRETRSDRSLPVQVPTTVNHHTRGPAARLPSRLAAPRVPCPLSRPAPDRTVVSVIYFPELKASARGRSLRAPNRAMITKRRRMERRKATWKAFERKCKIDPRTAGLLRGRRRRRPGMPFSGDVEVTARSQ